MRILLVTQMWPSGADPDFGAFLVPQVDELRALGHEVDVVAIDRRGGSAGVKYTRLGLRALRRARKIRPDVVIAHMLFPAGAAALVAAQSVKAPLVVVCHGQDVENLDGMQVRTVSALVSAPTLMASVSQFVTVSVLIACPAQTRSSWARAPAPASRSRTVLMPYSSTKRPAR